MHPTQLDILNSLRHAESRRFGELLLEAAETSDNLTYHLKQLQKSGFIETPSKGWYVLAYKGLAYLNNNLELGHDLFPTVSCILELHGSNDEVLVMRKLKQPHLGSVHLPTFGVESAESLSVQVEMFLNRYRITVADVTFHGVHRERIFNEEGHLFFDKFFMVFRGGFTSFERSVEDREFAAPPFQELVKDPQLLSASRVVLSRDSSVTFAEDTHPFVSG